MKRVGLISVALVALSMVVRPLPASAGWTQGAPGAGYSRARTMPGGNTPVVSVAGTSATVSWAASSFVAGPAVAGYVVRRYDSATMTPAAIGANCSGVVTGLTCVEANVPPGTWRWSVQPAQGNWRGAESAASAPAIVAAYSNEVLADTPGFYYRLGEASGSVANDSSGNTRHATYAPSGVTKGVAGALVGDPNTAITSTLGAGDAATYASGVGLPTANSVHSIEAWFKTTSTANNALVGWGTFGGFHHLNVFNGNTISYEDGNAGTLQVTVPNYNTDGLWHQVVVTHDGATQRMYYDAVLIGTRASTFSIPGGQPLHVGGNARGTPLSGSLDEVAIYPSVLSPARIAAHFTASNQSSPVPPAATGVVVVPGANSAAVSWNAIAMPPGRVAVSTYKVTALLGATPIATQSTTAPTTSTMFTGLDGGATYTFTVAGINAFGAGPAGTSSPSTTLGAGVSFRSTVMADAPSYYYRLDEPVGSSFSPEPAKDYSGNSRKATYTASGITRGVPGAIVGDSDAAVTSTAPTDVATRSSEASIPTGNAVHSIEAWFKTTSTANNALVGWGTFGGFHHLNVVGGNTISYEDGNAGTLQVTVPNYNTDGLWHQVVVTHDGATQRMYYDAVLIGTRASTFSIPGGQPLHIGGNARGTPLNGSLDEVAIYPSALSPARVAAHFAASGQSAVPLAPTNVVATPGTDAASVTWTAAAVPPGRPAVTSYVATAYLGSTPAASVVVNGATTNASFTELDGGATYTFGVRATNFFGAGPSGTSSAVTTAGTGTSYRSVVMADSPSHYYRLGDLAVSSTAPDYSGNGRNLVYERMNLTASAIGALTGDSDGAITGANGGPIATGSSAALPTGAAPRTVEAWFKRTDTAYDGLVSWGDKNTNQDGIFAARNASSLDYWQGPTFAVRVEGLPSMSDGTWHHAVFTYDGTTGRIYLDGVLRQTTVVALNTAAGTPFYLGSDDFNEHLNGSLDEVAVYPVALTLARIQAHYAARL